MEQQMPLKQFALKYLPDSVLKPVRARHYQDQLKHYDLNDEPDLLGCKALLRAGDVVFDIGANIGVYTRFCSEFVGPTGQIHSLEPIPETFSYLTSNVRALNLPNVTCYNLAASDRDQDHAAMSMPQYASGGANIYESTLSETGDIPVKVTRLDTLFPTLNPRLIKCDVEGHEVPCINGALKLIARSRPIWVVEVSNSRTFELFASLDYDVYIYEGGTFRIATPVDKTPNYFFLPREQSSLVSNSA
jgi:FkbM family methyltransferase